MAVKGNSHVLIPLEKQHHDFFFFTGKRKLKDYTASFVGVEISHNSIRGVNIIRIDHSALGIGLRATRP